MAKTKAVIAVGKIEQRILLIRGDKVIIDARASFAHGQVYVALSRCTSLEGIVLKSKIADTSVVMDNTVDRIR